MPRFNPRKPDKITSMWLLLKRSLVLCIASLLAGCGQIFELVYCDYGYGAVQNNFYQTGVNLLNKCLELEHLSIGQQANYLQGRAWAHHNLENNNQALTDQALAFELKSPTQYHEFINHAAYLRRLQLFQESLNALRPAQKIDKLNGHPSMMTQYNLGWSLYKLNRFEESILAFTKGIPQQPDYPFVYLRRGLAYYKLGKSVNAEEDFSEFLLLIGEQEVNIPETIKQELRELPSTYNDIKNL